MSDPTGALLLTLITFCFHLFMLIYSITCCLSFQDTLFLGTDKGGKAKGESQLSYPSWATQSGGEGKLLPRSTMQ